MSQDWSLIADIRSDCDEAECPLGGERYDKEEEKDMFKSYELNSSQ